MTSTTRATTRLGSQSSSCWRTPETAGSPSVSKATTSVMSRTNHLTMPAITPAESSLTPVFCTKVGEPGASSEIVELDGMEQGLDAATRAARRRSSPRSELRAKPMIRGMADRKVFSAPARDALSASPVSRIGTATDVPCILPPRQLGPFEPPTGWQWNSRHTVTRVTGGRRTGGQMDGWTNGETGGWWMLVGATSLISDHLPPVHPSTRPPYKPPKPRRRTTFKARAFIGVRKRSREPVPRFSLKVPKMGPL